MMSGKEIWKETALEADATENIPSVKDRTTFALPPADDPKYRKELGDSDLTEEQAAEFLRALDVILRGFVDLGFGVDAVQLAIPALAEYSAQAESLMDFSGPEESAEVQPDNHTSNFNSAAQKETPQKE